MATVKIASLLIRTLAKPIATQIKSQAKEHENFRKLCVGLAQRMHRSEIQLRTRLLGEPAKTIRPLSETRAIESGANSVAEGFLFVVAAAVIVGETWRSSHKESKRRQGVSDDIDGLQERVVQIESKMDEIKQMYEAEVVETRRKNDELGRVLQRVVDIGLRGGWAEFEEKPLQLPLIELITPEQRKQISSSSSSPMSNDTPDDSPTSSPVDSPPPESKSKNTQIDEDDSTTKK
ncbi:optic atrophy 3 protein-domain-containing protein [Flagelloscypha sp. PMI_526]|nr:optic atrophy 3 protein-domain-containing protein [Flagelloscypha sp. PMI_526]